MTDIIYGSPEQQAMMQRSNALWSLVGSDLRFCFQTRTVSIGGECNDAADPVAGLRRLPFHGGENAEAFAERY